MLSGTLTGWIYLQNPAALYTWYDDFVTLVDKASNGRPNILLLGDFNINLLVPQRAWESTFTILGFKQLIKDPTRVTETSTTLLDHIYVSEKSRVLSACNLKVAISDHDGVCCSWALRADKSNRKNQHTTILFRSFKHFNKDAFLADLSTIDFQSVYNCANPDDSLAEWYRLFLGVLDQHAPLRERRVKQAQLPPWLTKEIRDAMALRDELKQNKNFVTFRAQRNRVQYLVREAKKNLFKKMIENK